VKKYHEKFYCSKNLYLVITGMVEPQQVLETVGAFEQKIITKVCGVCLFGIVLLFGGSLLWPSGGVVLCLMCSVFTS